MTHIERFHQHMRDAAKSLEQAIDALDEMDPGDAEAVLASRDYLLGRLELLADATEAFLPETIHASVQKALEGLRESLGGE